MGKDSGRQEHTSNPFGCHEAETQEELIRISISDPITEKDKVRELYDALVRLKKTNSRELPSSYRQFSDYIAAQTSRIRGKHGCSRVSFTIAVEEDAIRFIAAAENP